MIITTIMKRRRSAILGLFVLATLFSTGLTRTAQAFYGSDKIYWDRASTSCNSCNPTLAFTTWATGNPPGFGNPYVISVIIGDPGCDAEWEEKATDSTTSGGNWVAELTLQLQNNFCSGTVRWRSAWEHQ